MSSPSQHDHRNNTSISFSREQRHQQSQQQQQQLSQQQSQSEQHSQSQSQSQSEQQLSSYASVVERAASAHKYAQKLNNISALCIETGLYDKAISSLGKALRLSELHIPDQLFDSSQACTCHECCSLDGCIIYSENNNYNIDSDLAELLDCDYNTNNNSINGDTSNNENKIDVDNTNIMSINNDDRRDGEDNNGGFTIYRRPIRIPPQSISEGHNMGPTLFLIITFNLAMVHHLKAISVSSASASASAVSSAASSASATATTAASTLTSLSSSLFDNTLQIYELARAWQKRHSNIVVSADDNNNNNDSIMSRWETTFEGQYQEQDEMQDEEQQHQDQEVEQDEGTTIAVAVATHHTNVRFNMILSNNISHVHQLMNNSDTMSE